MTANSAMDWILLLPWLPIGIWVAVLLLQCLCALGPIPALTLASRRPRVAVLIPAHNEAAGIGATLRSIAAQLLPADRMLVVADNCEDDTAAQAVAAGAEIVLRRDPERRGKGYALDHGLRHLSFDAPEVLIVVDADCLVEPGAIDTLARTCRAWGRPVQALYLMQGAGNASPFAGLREFAWRVRNLVRPLGWARLGQPCQLMGTGMAFPWALISAASVASAHLVEDMQLGAQLARSGAPPLFCAGAVVKSQFPTSAAGIGQQRRRWEHGHLAMIARAVPGLLAAAVRRRDAALFALALDMSVPPLALLTMLVVGAAALSLAVASPTALTLAILLPAGFAVAILLAWWRHGRAVLRLRTLLLAPLYVLSKLPLYAAFLHRRQVEWVRSARDKGVG